MCRIHLPQKLHGNRMVVAIANHPLENGNSTASKVPRWVAVLFRFLGAKNHAPLTQRLKPSSQCSLELFKTQSSHVKPFSKESLDTVCHCIVWELCAAGASKTRWSKGMKPPDGLLWGCYGVATWFAGRWIDWIVKHSRSIVNIHESSDDLQGK